MSRFEQSSAAAAAAAAGSVRRHGDQLVFIDLTTTINPNCYLERYSTLFCCEFLTRHAVHVAHYLLYF